MIGSLETNVPLRKRITSRGADLTRRRADERADVVDDDFNKSLSLVQLPLVLKPRVVVFESIRVASSAIITTLAFGSRQDFKSHNIRDIIQPTKECVKKKYFISDGFYLFILDRRLMLSDKTEQIIIRSSSFNEKQRRSNERANNGQYFIGPVSNRKRKPLSMNSL